MDFTMKPLLRFFIFIVFLLGSVSSTIQEKIFIHERGVPSSQLKKSPRLDDSDHVELLRRAIEEFKQNVPTYTGFFFLDLIFEIFKNIVVVILTLLVPAPPVDNTHQLPTQEFT